jgi:hypothetical protein
MSGRAEMQSVTLSHFHDDSCAKALFLACSRAVNQRATMAGSIRNSYSSKETLCTVY